MSSRTVLSARSASVTVIAQIAARGVSLLAIVGSTAIVARSTGVETYADWGTVLTLTALTAFLLDPGISPIVVRRLAQHPETAPSPAALAPVRLGLGVVALMLVIGVSVALRGTDVTTLAIVLGAQVLPRALVLNATPWLQLDHRLHRQTALEAIMATLGVAGLAAAALADASAPVLGLVGFTAPTALLAILMRRELAASPSRERDVPGPQRQRVRSLLVEVAPLALALLLVATTTRTFVVFLNRMADSQDVAEFVLAFQAIEQVIVAAGIVAGALLPLIAIQGAGRGADFVRDSSWHDLARVVSAIGALISAGLIAFAGPFTSIVGGPELERAANDLQRLAPMSAVIFPSILIAYVYVSSGLGRHYLAFNFVALCLNVVANLLLTARYGAPVSARITWGSEALVVALALLPAIRAGASGVRSAASIGALIATTAVSAELVAGDVLPAPVGAVLIGVVVLGLSWRMLWTTASSILRAPAER